MEFYLKLDKGIIYIHLSINGSYRASIKTPQLRGALGERCGPWASYVDNLGNK